ncbi:MAG: DUF389 domain-containing protein [bacterium]|nr:DUF389 domain-containing protein [bacterium]
MAKPKKNPKKPAGSGKSAGSKTKNEEEAPVEKEPGAVGQAMAEVDDLMRRRFGVLSQGIHNLFARLPDSLKIKRNDAKLMYEAIDKGARLKSLTYWLFVVSSCGISTLGLIINSPAVIIGAMLVAPLMSPIIGLGMGVAVNDTYLSVKSVLNILVSVVASILTAALITALVALDDVTPEILGRTNPTLLDLFIALFSGIVAALSSIRSGGDEALKSVAPGAAISVALMPPLCVVGFGLGIGFNWEMMWGAFLLFCTNLFAIIMVSSVFYYFVLTEYSPTKLIKSVRQARMNEELLYQDRRLKLLWSTANGDEPTSGKRFLFPLLLLVLIAYPLGISLLYLKKSNDVRRYVYTAFAEEQVEDLRFLRGPDTLNISRNAVTGDIFFSSAKSPGPNLEHEIETKIQESFPGVKVDLTLIRVAGDADLSAIRKTEELSLENSPITLQDSRRQAAASELVRRALALIVPRFAQEVGVVVDVRVVFSVNKMDQLIVHYVGKLMQPETERAVSGMIRDSIQQMQGDIRSVAMKRVGPASGQMECRGVTAAGVSRARARLEELAEPLRSNPHIKLRVEMGPRLELPDTISDQAPKTIEAVRKDNPRCLLTYKYTR